MPFAPPATMRRRGLPCLTPQTRRQRGDGSAKLPERATSARARRIFLTSPLRPVRCCCRRLGHTLHEPSPSRPRTRAVSIPNAQFRILLLRRLRLPLPLAPRTCSCRGRLDAFGDHRAACAASGVLAARAGPLENVRVMSASPT